MQGRFCEDFGIMTDREVEDELRRSNDAPFADSGPSETFSEAVSCLLMAAEEWRRSLRKNASIEEIVGWQQSMDRLMVILGDLERWTNDAASGNMSVQADLLKSCQLKALAVASEALSLLWTMVEPTEEEIPDSSLEEIRRNWQGSIARLTELCIVVASKHQKRFPESLTNVQIPDLIESYVDYQKDTLRRRVTPAVARLKQARVNGKIGEAEPAPLVGADDAGGARPTIVQHHSPVLATILGQALALEHPLVTWCVHLQSAGEDDIVRSLLKMCSDSVSVVDGQAQTIVETIVSWFWVDQPIDDWITRLADENLSLDRAELGKLDALVEEMAFGAQVQARYSQFVKSANLNLNDSLSEKILPEWTWKYATMERSLATTQWSYALSIAAPVSIVIDTSIQVPSVLEDAQYLSSRALERAASTNSLQAMGTVAHAVAHDIWSEDSPNGVAQALAQQRGCWGGEAAADPEPDETAPENKDFASALLGALDEDLKSNPATPHSSAPPSSNFLTTLAMGGTEKVRQLQLEGLFCVLNGTHAASGACRSLVSILDSLLEDEPSTVDEKATAMIQLAREELFRYAQTFETQLNGKIEDTVRVWCGSTDRSDSVDKSKCLETLQHFFLQEIFEIDAESIQELEKDERLEQGLVEPFKKSQFVSQLADRSEPDVLCRIGLSLAKKVVQIVIQSMENKKVTDFGAILIAKEIRVLQDCISKAIAPPVIEGAIPPPPSPELVAAWERLSQTIAVLQLETPDDWLIYSSTSVLEAEELRKILSMRVDFRSEAIQQVLDKCYPG